MSEMYQDYMRGTIVSQYPTFQLPHFRHSHLKSLTKRVVKTKT